MNEYIFSSSISGKEIKRIRNKCNLTQIRLASFLNVTKKTIERWESSKTEVTGPAVVLLKMLDDQPELVEYYEIPPRKTPLRIKYMCNDNICTIIDVDEKEKEIKIRNYTKRYLYCAFGKKENPTYEDYLNFLESRCFPRTRDKMKIILNQLEIPYYDPMLIIEKTKGKMAEDDFWLEIESD